MIKSLFLVGMLALATGSFSTSAHAVLFDFSSGDGGFEPDKSSGDAPEWNYTGLAWETPGVDEWEYNDLTSPVLTVDVDGDAVISLEHEYNFFEPEDFIDGGVLEARIIGRPFSIITPLGGYPVSNSGDDECSAVGEPCWSGDSGGPIIDTLIISGLNAGDLLQVRLRGEWEEDDVVSSTNWRIAWMDINFIAVPEPTILALMGLGLTGIGCGRRRRKIKGACQLF